MHQKGLGLHAGKLYVADIDRVHMIDKNLGRVTQTIAIEGALEARTNNGNEVC